jgi:hypothetical protein
LANDPIPDTTVKAIQLTLAVLIGICFFIFQRAEQDRLRTKYAISGAALLFAAVILYFCYQAQYEAWTCSYDSRGPVTIGSTLTPDAAEYMRQHPETSCERLLQVSIGMVEKIWPKNEIIFHHVSMIATFSLAIITFSLASLLVTFSVTQNGKKRL